MTAATPDRRPSATDGLEYLPDAAGTSLGEWLRLVATDGPVRLPAPVSEYLAEARSAGEV
ncbi:MAG: hypothetical protein ACYCTI_05580 [Acidimicrobiales bacterium]